MKRLLEFCCNWKYSQPTMAQSIIIKDIIDTEVDEEISNPTGVCNDNWKDLNVEEATIVLNTI